jgi:hypothetical protein
VPPHCLEHIRFLEIAFSPFSHLSCPRQEHPAFQDWPETLDWAKNKLKLTALTLRLIVYGAPEFSHRDCENMTHAEAKEVYATYFRILAPLQRLDTGHAGGLARFYAELAYPLQWTRWASAKIEANEDWLESKHRELKRRAEQFVMGERYGLVSVAAREPEKSLWACNWMF